MDSSGGTPGPYKRDIEALPENGGRAPISSFFAEAPVTRLIIVGDILIFAAMAVLSGGRALSQASQPMMLAWGADYGPLTLTSEPWRVLSSLFLHFDLLHIAFNMFALWQVGQSVESLYGSSKFLFVYLSAGVAGSLLSLFFHPSILSAGASGAVFGAFGALLVFLRLHAAAFKPGVVKSATGSILLLLIINLAWGMQKTYIDNAAHIGGFIGGLVAGLACLPSDARSHNWTARNIFLTAVMVAVLYAGVRWEVNSFPG